MDNFLYFCIPNFVMEMRRLMISGMLLMAMTVSAEPENDSLPLFEGEVSTEVNYGLHKHIRHPVMWDFPHIVASATLNLGKGWRVEAEMEYERFHQNGVWGNEFRGDYATNHLALTKELRLGGDLSLTVSAGIVPIPVGITNSGGPALTIYDPASEAAVMPMTWHDGGLVVGLRTGRWQLLAGTYVYGRAPLRERRMAGAAARADCLLPVGLRLGASCFYGNTYAGMLSLQDDADEGRRHEFCVAFDADFAKGGFVADGSVVHTRAHGKSAYGVEAGYNVLRGVWPAVELTPFVRYDGGFIPSGADFNRLTMGVHLAPWDGLMLKVEYAWQHDDGSRAKGVFNFSVGYGLRF